MNHREISLIEDPPPKCPYFTLPDPEFFVTPEDLERDEKTRPTNASLIDLFGYFDKMSDDQQTLFILTLMKHSSFQPDFDSMAKALNLANGGFVRRRFVAIAEKHGFNFDDDAFKSGASRAEDDALTPSTTSPKKRRRATRSTNTTPAHKKRLTEDTPRDQPSRETGPNGTSAKEALVDQSSIDAIETDGSGSESYVNVADMEAHSQ